MDSCAVLGTLIIWACVHGIEFLKNISIFSFFVSIFHKRKTNWNKWVTWSSTAEKKHFEELSHYKIRFLWIAINLHWNHCLLSYKHSISVNDSNAKMNVNAFVIIYTTCW